MDTKRILAKIDEINRYQDELNEIMPSSLDEYISSNEKRRACERLLQILIESVIDICYILNTSLNLGIPSDDEDVFSKLKARKVISQKTSLILNEMKGFRNILVHKYGKVDDEIVFEMLTENLSDFDMFKEEILKFINYNK